MTKKERMYQNIKDHGRNLNTIFNTNLDDIALSKKLYRIEQVAHRQAEQFCNDSNYTTWETDSDNILAKVNKILNNKSVPIFINGDARGYAIKINDQYMRDNNIKLYSDWGGYGIIAPDLS